MCSTPRVRTPNALQALAHTARRIQRSLVCAAMCTPRSYAQGAIAGICCLIGAAAAFWKMRESAEGEEAAAGGGSARQHSSVVNPMYDTAGDDNADERCVGTNHCVHVTSRSTVRCCPVCWGSGQSKRERERETHTDTDTDTHTHRERDRQTDTQRRGGGRVCLGFSKDPRPVLHQMFDGTRHATSVYCFVSLIYECCIELIRW